jgi:hypothetical protein
MSQFDPNQEMFFVVAVDDAFRVLSWSDLSSDWLLAGWKVADWFKARDYASAKLKAASRRFLDDKGTRIYERQSA